MSSGSADTSVEDLDFLDVDVAEANTLADNGTALLGDDGWLGAVLGEGVHAVVHDAAVVVGLAEHIDITKGVLVEVALVSCLNIFQMDGDVRVSVSSALLVPESQRVQKLVHHGSLSLTAVTDCHLGLTPNVTNRGVATAASDKMHVSFLVRTRLKVNASFAVHFRPRLNFV